MALRGALQSRAVRQLYERYPYPVDQAARPSSKWRLPPPAWLNAWWRPDSRRFAPRRVLIAGCGTGREAFGVARRLPNAELVGIDFSPRSIAIARRFSRQLGLSRRATFRVADLHDPRLPSLTGGDFDFVSCHGVLSYVTEPGRVLENLARCLADDGALYLGVNGQTHHSVRWRAALPAFGLDPMEWEEAPAGRRTLRLLDAIAEKSAAPRLAGRPTTYLASDVFGPPIRNLPLDAWLAMARPAGLHFVGSQSCGDSLKGLCERQLTSLLPRSRAELHVIEELLIPSAFHRLLFTRRPPPTAPWADARELLAWKPVRVGLYRMTVPRRITPGKLHTVKLESRPLNLRVTLELEAWTCELLRRANGKQSLRDLVRNASTRPPASSIRDAVYLFYLLGLVELLRPD
jgi:SAM-dependent methyltransferase